MYDRETNSRWSQFLGRAVDGPKRDAELTFVSSVIVSWGAWKAEHPDTLFLDTGSSGRPYDTYEEYYLDPDLIGAYGETNPDRRFDRKDIVLGVAIEMAHNLARWTARIGLGEQIVTTKTLRRRFFALAGRITRSARRLTLHLPQRWPWETQFSRALARLRAIPLPA